MFKMDDDARDSQNTILIQDGASDLISNEQKKNKKKKIIIIVVVVSAVVAIALALTLYFLLRPAPIPIDEKYYYDPNEQIKNYIVNKTIIKLGIISDFQLNDKKKQL
jgi:flagellar basal body-associated protein FliL